jgi:hypothetical protein
LRTVRVVFYLEQPCDSNTADQDEFEAEVYRGMGSVGVNTSTVHSICFHCGSVVGDVAFPEHYADEADHLRSRIAAGAFVVHFGGFNSTATLASATLVQVITTTSASGEFAGGAVGATTIQRDGVPDATLALIILVVLAVIIGLVVAVRRHRGGNKRATLTVVSGRGSSISGSSFASASASTPRNSNPGSCLSKLSIVDAVYSEFDTWSMDDDAFASTPQPLCQRLDSAPARTASGTSLASRCSSRISRMRLRSADLLNGSAWTRVLQPRQATSIGCNGDNGAGERELAWDTFPITPKRTDSLGGHPHSVGSGADEVATGAVFFP